MLSGTTSDANTIAGSLTYKDGEGMSFRSNAGGGAFVDQTGYDRIDSQRMASIPARALMPANGTEIWYRSNTGILTNSA